ncbi:hypothetical protein [Sinanaerobacter sp. ZZT-01]|uniref:hypothetical protein n=1 Tax=Sinanaerobacter sp. ZZT-01 TaxID=3111540 RepID=UPI002D76911F|nr:hypothetical protein [Sinanaerobacter sp. ZZT-01]WRR94424.1 hypothetical protein U5921_04725 [Sinanaerobacter sp. ZZT-01]
MKKCILFMLVVSLVFGLGIVSYAGNAEDAQIESVMNHYKMIDEKYEVGEVLSDEDATFIKENTQIISANTKLRSRGVIEKSKKPFRKDEEHLGVRVVFEGEVGGTSNFVYPAGQSFYGKTSAVAYKGLLSVKKMVTTVEITTWGLTGDDGMVKAYEGKLTASSTSEDPNHCYLDRSKSYTVVAPLLSVIHSWVDVTLDNGSFTIEGI